MNRILFALFLLISLSSAEAQNSVKNAVVPLYDQEIMRQHEDSLIAMFDKVRTLPNEIDRFNACYAFVPALVKALKEPGSYAYPFDSLRKWVSIIKPPDDSFRIFTWMVVKGNADDYRTIAYKYFGAIQKNNSEKLELIPLDDKSATLSSIEDKVLSNDQWLGAMYYNIHPYQYNGTQYYMLFGWDGNNSKSDKKLADLLYFQEDKAVFGAPVFEVLNNSTNTKSIKHRMILEYKEGSSVSLSYNNDEKKVVYDFLAPEDDKAKQIEGTGFSFIPDGTYQGLEFNPKTGIWEAREMVLKGVSMDAPPRPNPVFDKDKKATKNKSITPPAKNKKKSKSN